MHITELELRRLIAEAMTGSLHEKAVRGQGKDKRTLYHINRFRPARPQPKMSYLQEWDPEAFDPDTGKRDGDYVDVPGTDNWKRWWIKSPVNSGVFLTPNPVDIAINHGRSGHVYAYKVPQWVIEKSGGLHRYDSGSEVLIPEEVWNEAGSEIEFLGKSMDKEELWKKMMPSLFGRGHNRPATKPSWMSDKELERWTAGQNKFNLSGLRATKHPEDVIKLLKPDEVRAALNRFEEEYPEALTGKKLKPEWEKQPGERKGFPSLSQIGERPINKKDQELIDLLKKQLDESILRSMISQMLREDTHAFHGYKFGPSKIGLPGPEFDDESSVTADDVDDAVAWLEYEEPTELVAFSRGSAVLHQMMQDEPSSAGRVPPVTYVSPAAMRDWTSAPVPGAPGGSKVVHSMGDNIVPLKQGCQVASRAGTDMYIAPGKADGKDHVRTLKYRNGGGTKVDAVSCADDPDLPDWGGTGNASDEELAQQVKRGKELVAEHFFREFVKLLQEDPMGFVHDLAAASEDFGQEGEMFIGGDPGKGGGKAIKRAFNANADHQWLSTLDTVHWTESAHSLEYLIGKSKDELSTTMSLPGDKLKNPPGMQIGLWVKGRITLAANDHDQLFTGKWHDYMGSHAGYTDEEQEQRQRSSGINKLPHVSKDYSRYGQLKRGDEFAEKMARNTPYVLDQSTWHQADWSNTNEALVDNWNPVGIVMGKWVEPIKLSVQSLGDEKFKDQAGVNAPGIIGKIFELAVEFGIPIFDRDRNELWSPE